VHSKNKPYITSHHTQTNRSLCECDIRSSIYDNDEDIKSVKECFDRQTSQRFEEYEERMKGKRQKRKEERDKNIKKIIEKDKMDKSLAEKVEKGCLRCGCALGGVAAVVGIFGAIAVNEVKKAALVAAAQTGIEEGIKVAIEKLGNIVGLSQFNVFDWTAMVTPKTYDQSMELVTMVSKAYYECSELENASDFLFCQAIESMGKESYTLPLPTITREAAKAARAARDAAKTTEAAQIELANATSTHLYSAIGYSVLAIFIIVLVMKKENE
ncbi:surface antigen, partial [Plasmodium falciparum UGT5.1]